ncbi:hypothetical protein CRH09_39880 (plasmid) [Nocardia terpenica]|uniref:Uncharacterized protein n=1 Tax=Nocardia terpenica TaxID=455432 RepID=A0A291RZ23_9NOCA|nr:hypothetical protein CRH09_39880 [Nocardia terpenica]
MSNMARRTRVTVVSDKPDRSAIPAFESLQLRPVRSSAAAAMTSATFMYVFLATPPPVFFRPPRFLMRIGRIVRYCRS